MALLATASDKGKERAAGALSYLSMNENNKHVIAKAGGLFNIICILNFSLF